jgi:hypothetical protein
MQCYLYYGKICVLSSKLEANENLYFVQAIGIRLFRIHICNIPSCSFLQRWSAECARSGNRAGGSVLQQHQFTHPRQSQPAGVARYNAARTVQACRNWKLLKFGLFSLRYWYCTG